MLSDFNILSQTNLVWSIFFLLDTVIASELFDRVEHKGAGKNENRTCKRVTIVITCDHIVNAVTIEIHTCLAYGNSMT